MEAFVEDRHFILSRPPFNRNDNGREKLRNRQVESLWSVFQDPRIRIRNAILPLVFIRLSQVKGDVGWKKSKVTL